MTTPARRLRHTVLITLILLFLLVIGLMWYIFIRREPDPEGTLLFAMTDTTRSVWTEWYTLDLLSGDYQVWSTDPALLNGDNGLELSADQRQIIFSAEDPTFQTGHWYIAQLDGSNRMALPDSSLEISGWYSPHGWSQDGSKIILGFHRSPLSALGIFDVASHSIELITDFTNDIEPDWSPDGSQIVFTTSRDGYQELYLYTLASGEFTRLTNNKFQNDLKAKFSPDGRYIAYMTNRAVADSSAEIWIMNADGSNQRRLTDNQLDDVNPAWSLDSTSIIFTRSGPDVAAGEGDLWLYDLTTDQLRQMTTYPGYERFGVWSPNSEYLVYTHLERGVQDQLWLLRRDDLQTRLLVEGPTLQQMFSKAWLTWK